MYVTRRCSRNWRVNKTTWLRAHAYGPGSFSRSLKNFSFSCATLITWRDTTPGTSVHGPVMSSATSRTTFESGSNSTAISRVAFGAPGSINDGLIVTVLTDPLVACSCTRPLVLVHIKSPHWFGSWGNNRAEKFGPRSRRFRRADRRCKSRSQSGAGMKSMIPKTGCSPQTNLFFPSGVWRSLHIRTAALRTMGYSRLVVTSAVRFSSIVFVPMTTLSVLSVELAKSNPFQFVLEPF